MMTLDEYEKLRELIEDMCYQFLVGDECFTHIEVEDTYVAVCHTDRDRGAGRTRVDKNEFSKLFMHGQELADFDKKIKEGNE